MSPETELISVTVSSANIPRWISVQSFWASISFVSQPFPSMLPCWIISNHGSRQPSREDAENTTIPHLCLASSGEVEKIKQYEEVFCKSEFGGEMEVYGSMARGWMGTKSNLKDAYNIREFERKYVVPQL